MFLAVVFIIIGLLMLANALGLILGNSWGFFWAIIFLAIGFRLLAKKGKCPFCGWSYWEGKMHKKFHEKMGKECCQECCGGKEHGHCCEEENHN